jgi:glycopeptide antibiotics resistance protein
MSRTRSWKQRLGPDKLIVEPVAPGALPLPTVARKLARLLVVLSVAAVLFCGYFPFDFGFRGGIEQVSRRFDSTLIQRATAGDSAENVLFFMPFGFALGALLRRKWLPYWIGTAVAALVVSAALSTVVELGQAYLPNRDPSLTDIVNNSLGGLIGFGIYRLVGDPVLKALGRAIEAVERKMGALMLAVVGMLYAAAICATPILLGADAGSLAGWNPSFRLAIGDEFGNQRRAWEGLVSEAHVATKAADRDELAKLFAGADPLEVFGDALVASYDLRGEPPFDDRTGKNKPLELGDSMHFPGGTQSLALIPATNRAATQPSATRRAAATRVTGGRPFLSSLDHWLFTAEPVFALNRGVATSGQFTAIVTCASAKPEQYLGSRVLTISSDTSHRNLTIGQDGPKLLVRVRNQANGENGAAPEFALDDVFGSPQPHKIILTYADATLNVYIDGLRWKSSVRVTPEAATIWAMFPRGYWSFSLNGDDVSVNAYVYRAMVFLPLGALAAATVNQTHKRHRERAMMAAALVAATIVVMEALLTTIGAQHLNVGAILLSALCGAIGILVVKIRHGDRGSAWGLM